MTQVWERLALLSALAAATALGWVYLAWHAGMMTAMETAPRGAGQFMMILAMWIVMMAAMMLPSAAPTALVHAAVSRHVAAAREGFWRSPAFLAGYVLAWGGYSVIAAALQVWLERLALLSPTLVDASPLIGGLVVAAAGVYQLSPAKDACLRLCRTPLQFVAERWQPGIAGALRMGFSHGTYCVGCCGALMALLFVVGVMNLAWVAAIAAFVLLEKVAFPGTRVGRQVTGWGLIAAGVALAATWT